MTSRYRVEIEHEEDGRFVAEVVELPGVLAYGESAELASSQQIVDSYRATLDQAQAVVERTRISLSASTWLLRLIVVLMTLTGVALGTGLYVVGRALRPPVPPSPPGDESDLDAGGFDANVAG